MITKELGKIQNAEFGQVRGREYLFGLNLTFSGGGWGTCYSMCFNIHLHEDERLTEKKDNDYVEEIMLNINQLLKDANVNSISELVNKPVEVTFENRTFKSFRILSEVL